jgi:hypothetical protein
MSVTGVRPLPRILPIVQRAIPAAVERCVAAIATKAVELVSLAPDATHMRSPKVAVHASTAKAGNTVADETADTASAEGANMTSAKVDMASAKAADMASAESATVTTAATAAATRLRVGCKQAASERSGHQDCHYPSQHEFSFLFRGVFAVGLQSRSAFPLDRSPWLRSSARHRRHFRIFVTTGLLLRQSLTHDPDFSMWKGDQACGLHVDRPVDVWTGER